MAGLSPMMRQYKEIKAKYEDCILFFRLGDFYEMFFEDAKTASSELDLVLTGRDCGLEERAPMCGVPYHSCEAYIARLVEKGYHVAICEQTEDPAAAKGIVKRDIVRVITPGTIIEESMLDESKNNFLASVYVSAEGSAASFTDVSTGAVYATGINSLNTSKICDELGRFLPRELIINREISGLAEFCERIGCSITKSGPQYFNPEQTKEVLSAQFDQSNITALITHPNEAVQHAVAGAVTYISKTQMGGLERIRTVNIYEEQQYMHLDVTAIKNLELTTSMRDGEKKGSLLWVLDKTRTALGRRLLANWVKRPLTDYASITERHDAVETLSGNNMLLTELREALSGMSDIERLMTRIVYGTAGGRELRSLCNTAARLPQLKALLNSCEAPLLKRADLMLDPLEDICQMIDEAIVENPPFSVREGGIIKEGYSEELDMLSTDYSDGTGIISAVEEREREATGIKNLKVRYNRVFGYYIEVSNSNADRVPDRYIRKQTLTNCERYITEELKDLEARVLGAKEKRVRLEYEIFTEIRKKTAEALGRIQGTADAVALTDVLCSLAYVAMANNYCRPLLNTEGVIEIKDGRHPVVELMMKSPFVPNDTLLDENDNRCAIITGPNMAGKSTYMRQVALITLMSQIGSFVPAASANLAVADSVFTRVGASDDLATGRSTFMVEMSEVAFILEHATKNSLIILDEIGRGTSTYDGMSIARAVLEYVSSAEKIGAKTLFATHYHELTVLEGELDGVKNYNVAVKKRGDDITFLRRIVRGGADQSYGVEVARLSGIPDAVINRAKDILESMESGTAAPNVTSPAINRTTETGEDAALKNELIDLIAATDVNTLTPIEAMSKLYDIVNRAKNLS